MKLLALILVLVCLPVLAEETITTTTTTTGITRRPTVFPGDCGLFGPTMWHGYPRFSGGDTVTNIETVEVDDDSPASVDPLPPEFLSPPSNRQAVAWNKMPVIPDGITRKERDWAWFQDALGNYSLETKAGGKPLPWKFANDIHLPDIQDGVERMDEAWTWFTNSAHEYAFRNMGKFTVPRSLIDKWVSKYEKDIQPSKPFTAPFQVKMTDGNIYFAYARLVKMVDGKVNFISRWNEIDSHSIPEVQDGVKRDKSWRWFKDTNSNYLFISTNPSAPSSTNWEFANNPKLVALTDGKSRTGEAWAWFKNEEGALSFRLVGPFSLSQEQIAGIVNENPAMAGKRSFSIQMDDGNSYVVFAP